MPSGHAKEGIKMIRLPIFSNLQPGTSLPSPVPTGSGTEKTFQRAAHVAADRDPLLPAGRDPAQTQAQTQVLKKGPAAATGIAFSYSRATRFEMNFSATYTKRAQLELGQAKAPARLESLAVPLPKISELLGKIGDLLGSHGADSKGLPASGASPPEASPEDDIKRLIIEKFFGLEMEKTSLSMSWASGTKDTAMSVGRSVSFSSESYSRLDFSFDYHGTISWQGQIIDADMHFELHLEQMETVSYQAVQGFDEHGLQLLNPQSVDTGRYFISFLNGSTLEIMDKLSGLSTRIWGDPHVDLSDMPGRVNGEFSDLKKSSILTTFKLLDTTTVIVKAPDDGLIEEVEIFKNGRHIHGTGAGKHKGHPNRSAPAAGYFEVAHYNSIEMNLLMAQSDTVSAGGDGNDWFGEDGALVWGDGAGECHLPVGDGQMEPELA